MEEIKTEPVDFVREFQEYLTQQTHHVNMISGSVCAEKESGVPYQAVAPRSVQNGEDPPSVEVSLSMDEGSDVQIDGPERTCDGKYKCSYCNYANKGMARLIEHIRIHTGEKPHRCQLCPFASAYERHLEAHMRSHTGEKPYKCDLCAFRCSDRSNLSHHRRRRHKLLPTRVIRAPFTAKRMLSSLQKKTNSLGFSRRLLININAPSTGLPKSDHLDDFSHKMHHHLHCSEYKHRPKVDESEGNSKSTNELVFHNPLDQLSSLAGQLTNIHPESQTPASPDREEKPIIVQQVSTEQITVTMDSVQLSPPQKELPPSGHNSCNTDPKDAFVIVPERNSHQSIPETADTALHQQLIYQCQHCEVQFQDNILYTIHMGCHSYEHPFKCNICGHMCFDKYDFACHFARGQHKQK